MEEGVGNLAFLKRRTVKTELTSEKEKHLLVDSVQVNAAQNHSGTFFSAK